MILKTRKEQLIDEFCDKGGFRKKDVERAVEHVKFSHEERYKIDGL